MQPRRGRCSKNYLPPTPFKLVSDKTAVPKLQRAGPYGVGIATPYNAALDNTLHSQRLRFIWVQFEDEIEQAKQAINAVCKKYLFEFKYHQVEKVPGILRYGATCKRSLAAPAAHGW